MENIPANFGVKYILWAIWSNAITILMIAQTIFTTITLDPTLVSHNAAHWILICNAIAAAVLAQIKRNNPPTPLPPAGAKTGG